jgi:oxygen-independent coproporphyrinogen III oxidase
VAGIYIHIPFCRQKCHYCNFFSLASFKQKDNFLQALKHEIILRRDYLQGDAVRTIYFGGGTPSLLTPREIREIITEIARNYAVFPLPEITLEANPDDLSPLFLREIKNAGINRLSIGIQSFYDEDLIYLNRRHDGKKALDCLLWAASEGFENISADLIFGMPTLTDDHLSENLETLTKLKVPHISAYALTVEEKTALAKFIETGKVIPPSEEQTARQFEIVMLKLKEAGYIHYEISNFCKEGFRSKHNSSYWSREKYLGLGPSAHSFNGLARSWNGSNLGEYIQSVKAGTPTGGSEVLTRTEQFNEHIMTSLRTDSGIDPEKTSANFGDLQTEQFGLILQKHIDEGNLELKGKSITLTDKGKLLADRVISDLFS